MSAETINKAIEILSNVFFIGWGMIMTGFAVYGVFYGLGRPSSKKDAKPGRESEIL